MEMELLEQSSEVTNEDAPSSGGDQQPTNRYESDPDLSGPDDGPWMVPTRTETRPTAWWMRASPQTDVTLYQVRNVMSDIVPVWWDNLQEWEKAVLFKYAFDWHQRKQINPELDYNTIASHLGHPEISESQFKYADREFKLMSKEQLDIYRNKEDAKSQIHFPDAKSRQLMLADRDMDDEEVVDASSCSCERMCCSCCKCEDFASCLLLSSGISIAVGCYFCGFGPLALIIYHVQDEEDKHLEPLESWITLVNWSLFLLLFLMMLFKGAVNKIEWYLTKKLTKWFGSCCSDEKTIIIPTLKFRDLIGDETTHKDFAVTGSRANFRPNFDVIRVTDNLSPCYFEFFDFQAQKFLKLTSMSQLDEPVVRIRAKPRIARSNNNARAALEEYFQSSESKLSESCRFVDYTLYGLFIFAFFPMWPGFHRVHNDEDFAGSNTASQFLYVENILTSSLFYLGACSFANDCMKELYLWEQSANTLLYRIKHWYAQASHYDQENVLKIMNRKTHIGKAHSAQHEEKNQGEAHTNRLTYSHPISSDDPNLSQADLKYAAPSATRATSSSFASDPGLTDVIVGSADFDTPFSSSSSSSPITARNGKKEESGRSRSDKKEPILQERGRRNSSYYRKRAARDKRLGKVITTTLQSIHSHLGINESLPPTIDQEQLEIWRHYLQLVVDWLETKDKLPAVLLVIQVILVLPLYTFLLCVIFAPFWNLLDDNPGSLITLWLYNAALTLFLMIQLYKSLGIMSTVIECNKYFKKLCSVDRVPIANGVYTIIQEEEPAFGLFIGSLRWSAFYGVAGSGATTLLGYWAKQALS